MKFAVTLCVFVVLANAITACPDEPNCTRCSKPEDGERKCLVCENSFFNAEKKACDSTLSKKINQCKSYIQKDADIKCSSCENGFILVENACVRCTTENCALCDKNQVCFGCFGTWKLIRVPEDFTKNSCSKDDKCSVANCDICVSNQGVEECAFCKPGYAVEAVGHTCAAAPANCNSINKEGDQVCAVCNWGFYQAADGSCKANPAPPTPPSGSWAWLWVVLILIILAVAGYFAYNHFNKNQRDAENVYLSA